MSAFRKATKTSSRIHRERSQPEHRKYLGMLEKKRDYRLRASDHQRKEKTLKLLRQKALSRNPDEFYFKMINTGLKDGVHQCQENEVPAYSDGQLKLMTTEDIRFIRAKRQLELRKIEKLKSSLHLIDQTDVQPASHILFVDSADDAKTIRNQIGKKEGSTDNTLLRSHRLDHIPQLILHEESRFKKIGNDETVKTLSARQAYRQLKTRLHRLEQLDIVLSKMELKKRLMSDEARPVDPNIRKRLGRKGLPKLVVRETPQNAAVYEWPKRRQK